MDIELDRAIRGFKLSNEAAGLSPRTIVWYNGNLRLFQKWLAIRGNPDPLLEQITSLMIREYMVEMRNGSRATFEDHPFRPKEDHPMAPRTIQAYHTSLSAFFRWAVREELLESSPMKNMPRPKVPRYLPDPFNEAEIRALVNACDQFTDRSKLRLKAMILFLLDTGVRVGELLSVKMANLELEQGRARVMGKGAKERDVYFGKATRNALWRYISLARPEPFQRVDNLFLYHDGRPIISRRFTSWLEELSKRSGVENVHPHRFRRTAAVQFIRNGGDIFSLQKLLGHTTLEMVRRYVELAAEDVEKAHRLASPVDGWQLR